MFNRFSASGIVAAAVVAVAAFAIPAPAFAQDSVMFNYQGRVKVHGQDFNGSGQFKFAIISTDGNATLWSNDSTSSDGAEPTTGITLNVTDGVFDVLMGANGTMDAINSTVFQSRTPLKLRTWFSDGTHGFQQLYPDHNLVNTNLITSETGDNDFTIYVNGETGNDHNSGLKPQHAKKTISAAVNILPGRIRANVTIDIANGTYPEEVKVSGIAVDLGKTLKFNGDKTWIPAAGGAPQVIITGADGNTVGVRENGINASQCTGVEFDGFTLEKASGDGLVVVNGIYTINNCVARSNGGYCGLGMANQSSGNMTNCIAIDNAVHGIAFTAFTRCVMTSCTASRNGQSGLVAGGNAIVDMNTKGDFSNNAVDGILNYSASQIGASPDFVGTIKNNGRYGISATFYSFFTDVVSHSSITGNVSGPSLALTGGQTNW